MGSSTVALSVLFEGIGRKVGRMGRVHSKAVRVGVPLDVIRLPRCGDRSSRDGGWLDPARQPASLPRPLFSLPLFSLLHERHRPLFYSFTVCVVDDRGDELRVRVL